MRSRIFFLLITFIHLALLNSCGEDGLTNKKADEREGATQSLPNEERNKQENLNIPVTKIGDQVWMNNNLDVATFRNGDSIMHARTVEEWTNAAEKEEPGWCYWENKDLEGRPTGKLYNWYAVNDPRGLAPEGWRIPSVKDWLRLYNYRGPDEGLLPVPPTSTRNAAGKFKEGSFGFVTKCWSATESENPGNAKLVLLHALESTHPNYMSNPEMISGPKGAGISVRCLKN